jgi:general secretion pathway protein A
MTPQHREALAGLIYSVCTKSGLTVLMGEAGTGKTTLLFSLLGMLEKKRLVTAMCTNSTLTREEFYDTLMLKFGIACTSTLKSRQLLALQDMLQRNLADGRPSVLIVDEAQRLSMELLEEIRLLLNLETPREKLLSVIISGQPELGDLLARPELRQLRQRIGCNCKLKALSFSELQEYLQHRLKQAGVLSQTLFHEDTVELIYDFTQGIPRLVNSLCSSALQTGFAIQSRNITPAIIEEAARDLDLQRPMAMPKSGVAPLAAGAENFPPTRLAAVPPVPKANPAADGQSDRHVPLDSYAARQESLGFFSGLLDRWR